MKTLHNTTTINVSNATDRFTDFSELHPIPTNCIIDKKLPGFGATHSELVSHRNSILILPNVASIISKAGFYNSPEAAAKFNLPQNYKVLAIHEKVKSKDLQNYLRDNNDHVISILSEALKRLKPYSYLINEDETINYFKFDNYFYEEKIKSYYSSIEKLKAVYALSDHFEISYASSDVPYFNPNKDEEERGKYSKVNYRDVTDALFQLEDHVGTTFYTYAINELYKTFEHIVTAYNNLGIEVLLKHEFSHRRIMQEVIKEHAEREWNRQPLIDAVHNYFSLGRIYKLSEIKEALHSLCEFHAVPGSTTAVDIKRFYKVEETKSGGQRAYKLLETQQFGKYNRR